MTITTLDVVERAPVRTWFGVGGSAERYAIVRSEAELGSALALDPDARVLGDGANLIVADSGVRGMVVKLGADGTFGSFEIDDASGVVVAGAGVSLPRLVKATAKAGLAGIEGIAGVPATIGGAVTMNAGGAHGAIGDVLESVRLMRRDGRVDEVGRDGLGLGYRTSSLDGGIVLSAALRLTPTDAEDTWSRMDEVMRAKSATQPLGPGSAGCAFRNPTLEQDVEGIGRAGERVSAGLIIDRVGLKGLSVGGARVSQRHANFIEAQDGSTADDVLSLIGEVRRRVFDATGVRLRREVVVWGEHAEAAGA